MFFDGLPSNNFNPRTPLDISAEPAEKELISGSWRTEYNTFESIRAEVSSSLVHQYMLMYFLQ